MRIKNPDLPDSQTTRPPASTPEISTGTFLGSVNPIEEQRKQLQKQLLLAVLITVLVGVGAFFIYKAKNK